jgi:hypothetical protein
MDENRYTQSQVFFGLREAWGSITGNDDAFDLDTRIVAFMKADGSWDDLDFADIFQHLEEFFGFTCSLKEWKDFFGSDRSLDDWEQNVAPHLTFGSLAQFIADRAPRVASFEPIPVLGRYCLSAGIFTGIQRVAEHVSGKRLSFPPSAQIIDVFQGHDLDNFWSQLRWMTENSIPELPAFWRGVTGNAGCIAFLAALCGFIAAWTTTNVFWIIPALSSGAVLCLIAYSYKRFTNPLPAHIASFRDLATLIAKCSANSAKQ